ncbi:MAG TPA: hypothetical protein VMW95_00290 [Desulfobacterales bacterium]|nr:hypothetical protein [Desulfobacterales bacterium]
MKYGSKLEFFANVEAEGGHIPALDDRPRLFEDLVEDFNIFIELSLGRQWDSMAGFPHPIKFSEIDAYLRIYDVNDQAQKLRLINRIKFMDQVYLEYHREQHGRHTDNTRRKKRDNRRGST